MWMLTVGLVFIVQTLSFMNCSCNFICGLSDVIIKTFSQSVSNYLLSQCAQRMYILKLLRHQGMSSDKIITVAYSLILSRIMYALPAWGGFLSAALIDKIDAFFKRSKRFGYISTCYTVSELIVNCDHDLFTKATGYWHCLHHLPRRIDHLRPRGHPFQLYPAITDLHKRSFVVRFLYNFMWLMCIVYFICSFCSYVLSCICCVRLSYYR